MTIIEYFQLLTSSSILMHSSKVKNDHESSFRRKPESSNFNLLQKIWTPVFTGVTTFDELININPLTFSQSNGTSLITTAIGIDQHFKQATANIVQPGADVSFKSFKIKNTGAGPLGKILPDNMFYLVLYFFMNKFCNFFLSSISSWSSLASLTGRKSEIRSLTKTSSSQSLLNFLWLSICSIYFCNSGPSFKLLA